MIATGLGPRPATGKRPDMSELAESVHQLGTHCKLVSQTEQRELDTELKLDAIIVPASRPAQNLEQAITLAQAMRCTLLILCSRRVSAAEVQRVARATVIHTMRSWSACPTATAMNCSISAPWRPLRTTCRRLLLPRHRPQHEAKSGPHPGPDAGMAAYILPG